MKGQPVHQERAEIVSNEKAGEETYIIRLRSEYFSNEARPGQFFHVRVADSSDPLLRRPISLHRLRWDSRCIDLLYKLKGRGTHLLAERKPGERLDVIGPLGNGFPDPEGKLYLIAGGMGVAPFPAIVEDLCGGGNVVDVTAFIGARTASALLCMDELESLGVTVNVATEDGSAGYHGNVSDHVKSVAVPDVIFCCGPSGMIRTIINYAIDVGVECHASVEERMGCGTGMCGACAIKLSDGNGVYYGRVCKDGPVFSASQLSEWAKG